MAPDSCLLDSPLRLGLLEESEVIAHGLRACFSRSDPVTVVELRSNDVPSSDSLDLLLYDPFNSRRGEFPCFGPLFTPNTRGRVVVFTFYSSDQLASGIRPLGARGCLFKGAGPETVARDLTRIHNGEFVTEIGPDDVQRRISASDLSVLHSLSPRQLEVVALVSRGLSNAEIAEVTRLSVNTVKSYIRMAYRTMEATSRSQAILWGMEHGLGPPGRELFASCSIEQTPLRKPER